MSLNFKVFKNNNHQLLEVSQHFQFMSWFLELSLMFLVWHYAFLKIWEHCKCSMGPWEQRCLTDSDQELFWERIICGCLQ